MIQACGEAYKRRRESLEVAFAFPSMMDPSELFLHLVSPEVLAIWHGHGLGSVTVFKMLTTPLYILKIHRALLLFFSQTDFEHSSPTLSIFRNFKMMLPSSISL